MKPTLKLRTQGLFASFCKILVKKTPYIVFFCMFVLQECFGKDPKTHIYDKRLPTGSNCESVVRLFLEHSCNPTGSLAYKTIFDMQEEKKFVGRPLRHGTTVSKNKVTDLMQAVWLICTIDHDQKILKTLHYMYISSVANRANLPDAELDRITNLYQCLKEFYEETAKEVRHA